MSFGLEVHKLRELERKFSAQHVQLSDHSPLSRLSNVSQDDCFAPLLIMAEDGLIYSLRTKNNVLKGGVARDASGQIKRLFRVQAAAFGETPQKVTNRDLIMAERERYTGYEALQLLDTPGVERFLAPYALECSDTCEECGRQYRSMHAQTVDVFAYARELTDAEAISGIATTTDCIKKDLSFLRGQIPANGGALLSRWRKKSKLERKRLLLSAMPNMYAKKWAVPNLDYGIPGVDWADREEDRNA